MLTTSEAQTMATNSHLTGAQLKSVDADLRAKFGKNLIEAGLSEAIPKQNSRFAPFFTMEKKVFMTRIWFLWILSLFSSVIGYRNS